MMRALLLPLLLILSTGASRLYRDPPAGKLAEFEQTIFQQKLDHFDLTDTRTFSQRYWVNYDHWSRNDAPIFLYINGEGPVSGPPSDDQDFVVQLAKKFGGIIVTLEHRYYGGSAPFQELSVENLKYLNVEQALRDLETFVLNFRDGLRASKPGATFKIFSIGVSYSGALSAWFRLKYPHVTEGSISSSGVVNAILEFDQFDTQIVLATGPVCSNLLLKAMRLLEAAIEDDSANTKSKFGADMLTDEDFYLMMGDVTGELVQYGSQDDLCIPLVNSQGANLVDVLANITKNSWSGRFGQPYQYSQDHLKNTTSVYQWADRQWWWQTCTELAYFQIAPQQNSVRSSTVNLDYFRGLCSNVFGEGTWPNTNATNNAFGGNKIAATRVLFSNGSQDPWKWAGVTKSLSKEEPAVVVECHNCGHGVITRGCPGGCLPSNNTLLKARAVATELVKKWLQ